jgi:prepilin-type processing-associated H-X9-DG protein
MKLRSVHSRHSAAFSLVELRNEVVEALGSQGPLSLSSVGCKARAHDCTLPTWPTDWWGRSQWEQPYRYATNSRDIASFSKPSAWVASCLRPYTYYDKYQRGFRSHFGYRQPVPLGSKFNVLHLDGHVDDSMWAEYLPESDDWLFARYSNPGHVSVYGWRFKSVSGTDWRQGIEVIPGFPRPFDENR